MNVLPVSNGTVQLTGSGERIKICSGDFTLVGSGGDFIICSTSGCGNGLGPTCVRDSSSAVVVNFKNELSLNKKNERWLAHY